MPKLRDRNCRDVRVKAISDFINGHLWRVTVLDIRYPNYATEVAIYVGDGAHRRAAAHAKRLRKAMKVLPIKRSRSYDAEVASAVVEAMDAMSPQRQRALVKKLTDRLGT